MSEKENVVLIVDDSKLNLMIVCEMLGQDYTVIPVNSGKAALHLLEKMLPDIILLDVEMPMMNGYEVLRILKETPRLANIPVIFLTGIIDANSETKAFENGAIDYILKPINKNVLLARLKFHLEFELYKNNLEKLVEKKTEQILSMQDMTLRLLAQVTDLRDKETGKHIKRTSAYVCCIMDELFDHEIPSYKIDQEFYNNLKRLSPLHDIGKVSIPDYILLKPGKLTDEEFEIMKTHAENGACIIKDAMEEDSNYSFLSFLFYLVLSHHEKWDGSGYPMGLSGEKIPLSGRIMAIADVYDALTTERPYKPPFSHEKAVQIMKDSNETHFDPVLMDIFFKVEDKILEIKEQLQG